MQAAAKPTTKLASSGLAWSHAANAVTNHWDKAGEDAGFVEMKQASNK